MPEKLASIKTVKGVLQRAKSRLVKHGWGQNMYYNGATGCYCIAGAVYYTLSEYGSVADNMTKKNLALRTFKALIKAAGLEVPGDTHYIESTLLNWNDECERTRESILDVMDSAIAHAR